MTHEHRHRFRTARTRREGSRLFAVPALVGLALLVGCGSPGRTIRAPLLTPDQVERTPTSVTPIVSLNSSQDDFGVSMPLDTTQMCFTSARDGAPARQSIFFARVTDGKWSAPSAAEELNNQHPNGAASMTPAGDVVYFAGYGYGLGDCDIYRARVGPRGAILPGVIPWSVPENLGMRINGSFWDSQPCIAPDGSVLYFASDRPGGFGGRDIWQCRRAKDGAWESPTNLGEPVNTPGDDVTPWVSPDHSTLFFSSDGHPGIGGFDVFAATSHDGVTQVRHLGMPINSTDDDICFSLSADGRLAFLASDRTGGRGGLDLYRVSPVPVPIDPHVIVRGIVRNRPGAPQAATIEVTDLGSTQLVGSFTTDPETGTFAIVLPRGYSYAVTATAPGYLFASRQVSVARDLERDDERRVDLTLNDASGAMELLVFFPKDRANLLRESHAELDRVVHVLLENPGMTVEIAGHTDSTDSPDAAQRLSRERAQSVRSYLIANRVPGERISAVGYGAARPIGDNRTPEGRALNRRIEMRIIEPR